MSAFRAALTVASVALSVARHPAVRAGLKAAPRLITPEMRNKAGEAVLDAAYRAGAAARKILPRKPADQG